MLLNPASRPKSDCDVAATPNPYPFACKRRVNVKTLGAGMEMLEGRQLLSVAAPLNLDAGDLPKEVTKAITKELKNLDKADKHEEKADKKADKADKKHDQNVLSQLVNVRIPKLSASDLSVDPTTGDVVATIDVPVNTLAGTQMVPVTFTLDRTVPTSADQVTAAITTDILNLELGPINLDVLGLVVETSPICLDITATTGPGNLLGNLLNAVANLLNGPTLDLGAIANGLNRLLPATLGFDLTRFATQGDGLVAQGNFVLGFAGRTASVPFASPLFHDPGEDECPILNLELGPLDLNLLGLGVHLDDCDDGPVTVDITAVPGPGNLLGNLLCGVVGLLDGGFPPGFVGNLLNRILDRLIDRILDRL